MNKELKPSEVLLWYYTSQVTLSILDSRYYDDFDYWWFWKLVYDKGVEIQKWYDWHSGWKSWM